MANELAHMSPEYLHGEVLAVAALVIRLAAVTTDPIAFREEGLQALELLRETLLPQPVSDAQLAGVEIVARMVRAM